MLGFNDLLPLFSTMVDRTWAIWGLHTTVAIAVIGWIISQKTKNFDMPVKAVATIGYSVFAISILSSFYYAYKDMDWLVRDLEGLKGTFGFVESGYLQKKLLDFNFIDSFMKPLVTVLAFYSLIIFLIWNDRVWQLLRKSQNES